MAAILAIALCLSVSALMIRTPQHLACGPSIQIDALANGPQSSPNQTLPPAAPAGINPEDIGVARLPAVLWLEIFAMGKRIDDTLLFTSTTPRNSPTDSVSALSQTCSSFRQLAINSRILWTAIYIDEKSNVSDIIHRIDRSCPLTLDIAIHVADGDGVSGGLGWKNVDACVDIVISEIGRWRSLRIRLGVEQASHPVVMRLRDRRATHLEHLSVSVQAREPGNILPVPHILNYGAPRLVSTKLRGVAHTFYRPPLADLTTLRLEGIGHLKMHFMTFVEVLTQPTRLRHLLIRKDIVSPDVWALQSPGSLPLRKLRSLHMYSESGAMYAGFLLTVDAPQLSALTLEGVFDRDLDALWNQATPQKFANLTHLKCITEDDMSTTTYVRACRQFPNVTHYTTQTATPSTSQVVTILNGKPKQPNGEPFVGWPSLQTLNLALDSSAESMEYIQQVVDARINVGCPLGQICFFRSKDYSWMSEDEWSTRLGIAVHLVGYTETFPGVASYMDIDDVAE